MNEFIRLKEVIKMTGLSKSSIYKFIADGTFPVQIKVGVRMVRWIHGEIQNWIDSRITQSRLNSAS